MMLFGLEGSWPEACKLARGMHVELALHEEREFEDSEFKIRPLESVREAHVVVYHSLYADKAGSASDKLCRLAFFIGALKDSAASSVTAIVPYLAFSRKDRRTKSRDPITTRYVAQMLESVGLDAIVTADVHNLAAFENAFRCRKQNLSAAAVLADHFAPMAASAPRVTVMSPDVGGIKRARAFAEVFTERSGVSANLAFADKHRSEGVVSGELFAGEVEGAFVIVIDDLISGGTTMARAADACKSRGALSVHAAATHGLFSPGAAQRLVASALDSIVVTDTAGDVRARCAELGSKLVVLETAGLFAEAARRES